MAYKIYNIEARSDEQREAMEALLDPKVDLVALLGSAGTGKTLLALAAALYQVHDEQKYEKLLVARPLTPLGKDIGHLPGTKDEKLAPWMSPFFDNARVIFNTEELDFRNVQIFGPEKFEMEAITFMRGRSFTNHFLIIDECQNLTYHELKTIITRSGRGTKIVLLGDKDQSDVFTQKGETIPVLDILSDFGQSQLVKIIELTTVERSRLAKLGVKKLTRE